MFPAGTQYSGNIHCVFPQLCNVPGIEGTIREHVQAKYLKKILDGKVVFVFKVYDLMITNVDFLANSSNHKAVFPEYSKNIPLISILNIFQGYPGIL